MTDRIERILGVLDNATQTSPEHGYGALAAPEACWRCDCRLDNDGPTELCNRCIEEMQKERPASPSIFTNGPRVYVALDPGWSPPPIRAWGGRIVGHCRTNPEDECSPEFPCPYCFPGHDRERVEQLVGAFPDWAPEQIDAILRALLAVAALPVAVLELFQENF